MVKVRSALAGPSLADKALPASRVSRINSVALKAVARAVHPLETFSMNSKRCLVISREAAGRKHRPKVKTLS